MARLPGDSAGLEIACVGVAVGPVLPEAPQTLRHHSFVP